MRWGEQRSSLPRSPARGKEKVVVGVLWEVVVAVV